jgi:predicted nuclease of predicted toxin-antitoxin system
VKVLLDECINWRLARDLVGHDVKTILQMGWAATKNGELLALAADSFDVFVTVDRNLPFQQNLANRPIAIIILAAKTNRLVDIKLLIPRLARAIENAKPGTFHVVSP